MKSCNSPGGSSLGGKIAACLRMEFLLFLSSGREVPARFPWQDISALEQRGPSWVGYVPGPLEQTCFVKALELRCVAGTWLLLSFPGYRWWSGVVWGLCAGGQEWHSTGTRFSVFSVTCRLAAHP